MTEWIVTSCVLILGVIGLRFLLKGKISLRLQYALWLLVLLRLLIPVSPPSTISIMNLVPKTEALPQNTGYVAHPIPDTGIPDITLSPGPVEQQSPQNEIQTQTDKTGNTVTPESILLFVWCIGMTVTAAVFLSCNVHFYLHLRRTRNVHFPPGCRLPLYITGFIKTPCLAGILKPAIYLPQEPFSENTLQHIRIHEECHFLHFDHIWSLLRCICLVLHWYNPLVWVAAHLSCRDAELACDEAALKQLGDDARSAYGATLIRISCNQKNTSGMLLTATSMTGNRKSLKERITMIAKKPKTTFVALIAVILGALVIAGCTFTGEKKNENSLEFSQDHAIFVYEKPGFGSEFFIKLNKDGTFTYKTGSLSSYFGAGTWKQEGDLLRLTDNITTYDFYNEFRVDGNTLLWQSGNSSGFMGVTVSDGDKFLYRGTDDSPISVMSSIDDLPSVILSYMDGGEAGVFVNVEGTVYVWDHQMVDTLDGLAVSGVGTVTANFPMWIPEIHLSACRVPIGTVLYKGQDIRCTKYDAVYCLLGDNGNYAHFLPIEAFRGEERWWEHKEIHDSHKILTVDSIKELVREKGQLISHRDFEGYSHIELENTENHIIYRLYDVEGGYRLMLLSADVQAEIEVYSARFYRKDTPDIYIDIRTNSIDDFIAMPESLLNAALIIENNKTGEVIVTTYVSKPE